MKRFGQEVFVTIESKDNVGILNAAGLRIDFEVKELSGFSRAKITIWNLNEETIGNLIGGNQDHYISLTTRLHGGSEFQLVDGFYISNSIDHKQLPDTITTLYCYSGLKKEVLEKQVSAVAPKGSLKEQLKALRIAAKFKGEFKTSTFPKGLLEYVPDRPSDMPMNGSVSQVLNALGKEYSFRSHTIGDDIYLMYMPDLTQVTLTDLDNRTAITLDTNNMRANPKLSPAQLQINSNLDGNIRPTAVVDISKLLTAEGNFDEVALQVAADFAQQSVSGYKKFQVIEVTHSGSNYTGTWNTQASCVAPKQGATAPIGGTSWFNQ